MPNALPTLLFFGIAIAAAAAAIVEHSLKSGPGSDHLLSVRASVGDGGGVSVAAKPGKTIAAPMPKGGQGSEVSAAVKHGKITEAAMAFEGKAHSIPQDGVLE